MVGHEPGGNRPFQDVPGGAPGDHRTHAHGKPGRVGSKAILWRWWLVAAALSLGLWAIIIALLRG